MIKNVTTKVLFQAKMLKKIVQAQVISLLHK